jgi:hypothetical protein
MCAHVMLIMLLCCVVLCCVLLCASISRNVTPIGKSGCPQFECDFETPSNCMTCPDRCVDQCCTVGGDVMRHKMS